MYGPTTEKFVRSRIFRLYRKILPDPYNRLLIAAIRGCRSLIDVGCGSASPLAIRRGWKIGLDIWPQSLRLAKQRLTHDEYVRATAAALPFREKSVDGVFCLDVLEHLPKELGLFLISEAERVATEKVIILTPNGWLRQDEYNGNPCQQHLSSWSWSELKQRGYAIIGLRGFRALRRERGVARSPAPLSIILSSFSELIAFNRPWLAFQLFCEKSVRKVK